MHKYLPKQRVRVLTIHIAVPEEILAPGRLADEISALLTDNGIANPKSLVLDWEYDRWPKSDFENFPTIELSKKPHEGEAFCLLKLRKELQ